MKIKFLGQSGYIVTTEKAQILIDPYLSDIVNEVAGRERLLPSPIKPEEIRADAIICTHNHLDHLDVGSIPFIRDSQFFITTEEGKEKLRGLNKTNVLSMKVGESTEIGDIKITAVFAKHTVEAFGVIIESEGKVIYFSSDTLFDEKLFEISEYEPDIAFLCINGKLGNMNVDEAVEVAKKLGAKLYIPNHYDMFLSNSENPLLFTNKVKSSRILEFLEEIEI